MTDPTKPIKRRQQDQKTTRAILSKINHKLADPALSKEEWLSLVKDAVALAKTLGQARNAKTDYSRAESGQIF